MFADEGRRDHLVHGGLGWSRAAIITGVQGRVPGNTVMAIVSTLSW